MTDREVNELLARLVSGYSPTPLARKAALLTARRLPMSREEGEAAVTGDAYSLAKAALARCGSVLETNDEKQTAAGVVFSGMAGMDPAFAVLWIEGDRVRIRAAAKEGLIKQHTAERAVERLMAALTAGESE